MSALTLEHEFQLRVWGAIWTGDVSEVSACIAEERIHKHVRDGLWDRDASYLDSVERWHGDHRLATPWWWALPHVTTALQELEP